MKPFAASWIRALDTHPHGQANIRGRKIYILPTSYGMMYGLLLITLLIASINYANNPAFLLTFLLGGVFVQAIFQTWKNLLQLQVRELGAASVFAGDLAYPRFELSDPRGRGHYALSLAFDQQHIVMADCPPQSRTQVEIPLPTRRRGLMQSGRLCIETRFPLGLLRAWCYLDTHIVIKVWPQPIKGPLQTQAPMLQETRHEGNRGTGTDDFIGNRNYRSGDSPAHINWKALAGEKGLLVKEYGGDRMTSLWLDFEQIPIAATETRLQILAAAIEDAHHQGAYYGLRLPGCEIPPSRGDAHRRRCLDALALHGMPT